MNDYIVKPIDVAAMFETLGRWAAGCGAQTSRFPGRV